MIEHLTPEQFRHAQLLAMSEEDFQVAVIRLAQLHGWRVAAFRRARTLDGWRTPCQANAKGWPDLVCFRGHRQIAAELKSETGRLTEEQRQWLAAFEAAGVMTFVWRPKDWPLIEEVLK